MPALPQNIDDLSEVDLQSLVDNEATESETLEFKSEAYGPDGQAAREFLKDVSALANTSGGWLLLGVREQSGVAIALNPLTDDADKMQQRLESLLQSGVEPRIFGTRIRAVPVASGFILTIRVPRSAAPPHRVTANGMNKFYLRSSAGAYEASYAELRTMFIQSATASERFEQFRRERLDLLSNRKGPIALVETDDRLVIHMLPIAALKLPARHWRWMEDADGSAGAQLSVILPRRSRGTSCRAQAMRGMQARGAGRIHQSVEDWSRLEVVRLGAIAGN